MRWVFDPTEGWQLRWVCYQPGEGVSFVRIMRESDTDERRVRWNSISSWTEKLPASLTLEEAQAAAIAIRRMA